MVFSRNCSYENHTPHDHYAEITARVITALEAGTPPWRCPWDATKTGGPMMPQNAVTGARYRGINCLILGMSMLAFTNADPRWATYKQASNQGWQVRKGSRGATGFFYKKIEIDDRSDNDESAEPRTIPMLRTFTLFHASQIDGILRYVPPSLEDAPWREPEAMATIVRNSGAMIRFGGEKAFYAPLTDHIQLPVPSAFRSAASFASVECHELSHWTGAESRLNRNLKNAFGSPDYAREELRAEIAQVMVCAELGIEDCDFTNGAAYISGWTRRLRDDKREIFHAASDAQRIADYLLAFHPDWKARQTIEPPSTDSTTEHLAVAA